MTTNNPTSPFVRRHDLDALRAIAMLLGIALHAAISFAPVPWTVQDSQQSDFYYVLFACIHGFRMPLFFMLSGFFTAMLWRKRGLGGLIKQRLERIAIPLFLGCLTIVPAMWAVQHFVKPPSPAGSQNVAVSAAVVAGKTIRVRSVNESSGIAVDTARAGRDNASHLTIADNIANQLGVWDYLGSGTRGLEGPRWKALKRLLFRLPVFMHLWFLWFLCWLIAAFLIYATFANALKVGKHPTWLVSSPASLLWVIPLTMLPQSFMNPRSFGPDSSIGLLPGRSNPSRSAAKSVIAILGRVSQQR